MSDPEQDARLADAWRRGWEAGRESAADQHPEWVGEVISEGEAIVARGDLSREVEHRVDAAKEAWDEATRREKQIAVKERTMAEIKPMPELTTAQIHSPEREAVWQAIKSWDINVPAYYEGYCGATGSHVAVILNALDIGTEEP